jgi:hypothetical protein
VALRDAEQWVEGLVEESLALDLVGDGIGAGLFHPVRVGDGCLRILGIGLGNDLAGIEEIGEVKVYEYGQELNRLLRDSVYVFEALEKFFEVLGDFGGERRGIETPFAGGSAIGIGRAAVSRRE